MKLRLLLAVAILCASFTASAQVSVAPILQPHQTFVDASGAPCFGCSLYSYISGTTTPTPTYTDSGGVSQNTNPIILSVQGGANIWVNENISYKFVLKNALGATIWTVDNVESPGNLAGLIVSSPTASQTITQPSGTNLSINTSGGGEFRYNDSEVLTEGTGCGLATCLQLNPAATQTVTQPTGTYTKFNASSVDGNFVTANAGNLTIHAWGNSQTQGFGLPGCTTLICHPDTAWPAVFAAKMGWTLDNQAYGSSNCADLTYQGTSESIWDEIIDNNSRNIYGHYRNDQSQYGPLPYRVDFARGCIAAQTLWLAIPEVNKRRANGGFHDRTGIWSDGTINSTVSTTLTPGATMTFFVTGKTVYIATARVFGPDTASYTVSVGGVPVYDPTTKSYTFSQGLDRTQDPGFPVNENIIPYLIRVPGLTQETHAVTYTCTVVTTSPCIIFFAAGVSPDNSTANGPFLYSLSPINNSDGQSSGNFLQSITSNYYEEWKRMISEFNGDGLQVVGIDALNKNVYDPNTDTQPDGVHPSVTGAARIAAIAISKATAASTPLDRAPSAMVNASEAYGGIGAGPAPSPSGAGSTNPTYLIPKGSLWSSTAEQTGRFYMGYDGTAYFNRLADDLSNTFNLGIGHIMSVGAVDTQDTNFAAPGQITSTKTSNDAGGRVRALNNTVFVNMVAEGSNGDGVPDWPNSGILYSNQNLVIDSDLSQIAFQVARATKVALTASSLNTNVPITINVANVPVTVASPTTGRAACIKTAGATPIIGYCSTAVDSSGACTCN